MRQHVFDRGNRLDAELFGALGRQERIVAEQVHLKCLGSLGDRLADAAESDDPERLVGELRAHVFGPIPAALDEALIRRGHIAREGEHQGDGMFGGAHGVAGRRVHHDDAEPGGGLRVDIVGADSGPHDRLEPLVAFERLGRDFDAAAENGAIELGERRPQGVALESGAHFEFDARGVEHRQAFGGDGVENDNSGHDRKTLAAAACGKNEHYAGNAPRAKGPRALAGWKWTAKTAHPLTLYFPKIFSAEGSTSHM